MCIFGLFFTIKGSLDKSKTSKKFQKLANTLFYRFILFSVKLKMYI